MRRLHLLRVSALALSLAAACSGGGDGPSGPAAVARVTLAGITGPSDSLTVGDRRALSVTVAAANGAALTGRVVAWSTSDAAVASVDGSGAVTAVAPGQATITAESEGVRGQVAVAIRRRPVASVTLGRTADTLWLGRTKLLRAQSYGSDGSALTDRTFAWSAADTTRVTLVSAPDGSVTARGVALGTTQLTVRSEGATTTIAVVVIPVPIARVVVAAPDTIIIGRAATVRATAAAPDGTTLSSADLAGRTFAWTSDRAGIITVVSVDGTSATARAAAAGNATITAAAGGVSGSYTVIAARPTVARLTFDPSTLTLPLGGAGSVTVSAVDADGQPVSDAPIDYAITAGSNVVHISSTPASGGKSVLRVDGYSAGAAVVFAVSGTKGASLPVTVTGPAAPTLRAFPTSVTTTAGNHGRLTVTLTNAAGPQPTGTVTYSSSNSAVVAVDANGYLTTRQLGSATITATAGGLTATVPVTVATPPTSTFQIRLEPVGAVPPAVLTAAREAADRWQRIITAELSVAQVDLDYSQCDLGTTPLHTVTTGVIVYVHARNIDGPKNTLAYAGPCVVRGSSGGLPLVGDLVVDSADVSLLTGTSASLAADVLAHELGHVLGIGTLWGGGTAGGVLSQTIGGDMRFTGRYGADAAFRMGITGDAGFGAPIEDEGGAGTAGGHWRERTFYGELMTGWINTAPNPLSILSVMSLRDLGYQVTETGADITSPLTIAGGTAFSATSAVLANRIPLGGAGEPFQIGERLVRPKYAGAPNGTLRPIAPPK